MLNDPLTGHACSSTMVECDGKILCTWCQTQIKSCETFICCWLSCLTSQQHTCISQGWICSDNLTCCHSETEAADQPCYLTQSQYTDTGPTSPSTDPIMPGTWQGSHWSANFLVTGMTRPRKILSHVGLEPWIFCSQGGHLNH